MTIPTDDRVPVALIREAFQRSGLTLSELAKEAGLMSRDGNRMKPDTSRVARMLGLTFQQSGTGHCYVASFIRHDTAAKIVRAMGLDPVDFRDIGL